MEGLVDMIENICFKEIFEKLKKEGKNHLEGILEWLRNANIIDGKNITEDHAKEGLDTGLLSFSKFKGWFKNFADKNGLNIKDIAKNFGKGEGSHMEEEFERLHQQGKNNLDGIMKWMKEEKIIDAKSEPEARKLFDGVDPKNIETSKFKEVIDKMTKEEDGDTLESLLDRAPRLFNALDAGTSALKDL